MKCKNCGANYRTRELVCPYCGTQNLIGHIWMVQRSEAELEYERARKEAGKWGSAYVANRVLNRILLIGALIFFALMCLCFLAYGAEQTYIHIYKTSRTEEITDTMERYYQAGDFRELYRYMSKHELFGDEYYAYSQAALYHTVYEEYLVNSCKFLYLDEEQKQNDVYYLRKALQESAKVYCLDCGLYSALDEKNRELYEERKQEMLAFWQGTLGLTGEELAPLMDTENYAKYEDIERLSETAKERRAWQ